MRTTVHLKIERQSTVDQLRSGVDGVDGKKKESYLSDEEFRKVFGIGKEEFEGLASWKKLEMKKKAGLFYYVNPYPTISYYY